MKRRLLLFRMRLAFSFDDIQELLNVQNSLGTRQQAPKVLSEGNETSMEGLLRTGRLCSVTMFVVPPIGVSPTRQSTGIIIKAN